MMLWIALAAMTALAIGLLLPALVRRSAKTPSRAEYDLSVYRDQLAEIERDAVRGLIDPAQAAAARAEVGRRLIAADEAAKAAPGATGASRPSRAAAAIIAIAVPLAALSLYLVLGSPDLALRGASTQMTMEDRSTEALVAELGRRLRDRPDDPVGWALYARSLAGLGRYAESLPAFARAVALDPSDAELASRYAEAQIVAAGGTVTPPARQALEAVLALDPAEPRARYYLGLAEHQAGNTRAALERWLALEAESAADAPWRGMLAERIVAAAGAAGIDAGRLAAMRRDAAAKAPPLAAGGNEAAKGPTVEDMAAAARMAPEERAQMIRGMVEGLAARLESQPDDFDGWMRLGRARGALGEKDAAVQAYAKAASLRPRDPDALSLWLEAMADAAPKQQPMPVEIGRLAERILALDADRSSALWYAGAAKAAAGDARAARAHWERLLATLDPASPQHADLKRRIEALGAPEAR